MRKVEAPRANSLVHTHIAFFTWARAALTFSSLEWGLEEDAAHGCLTLLTQPTTPSSAQTWFWILVMYIECEKISDLLRFPFCSPSSSQSHRMCGGGLAPVQEGLACWVVGAGSYCLSASASYEHEGIAHGLGSTMVLRSSDPSFFPQTPASEVPLMGLVPRGLQALPTHLP